MKPTIRQLSSFAAALALALSTATAGAQEIPIEFKLSIPPMMSIIVDSSNDSRAEASSSISSPTYPVCSTGCASDSTGGLSEKSRFIEMKEVLTGNYDPNSYYCCDGGRQVGTGTAQFDNGFMDNYSTLLKFLVATWDEFDDTQSNDYGQSFSMSKSVNLGFSDPTSGYNPAAFPPTSDLTTDVSSSNATAQTTAEGWSGWNATLPAETPVSYAPVAPALNDLNYFFTNDSLATGDPYESCRDRVAVVMSNGRFSFDDCHQNPDCAPYPDDITSGIQKTADETARLLADHGVKTYYIGYNLESAVVPEFQMAAYSGGTCDIDPGPDATLGTLDDVIPSDCFYNVSSQAGMRMALEDIAAEVLAGTGSRTKTVTTSRTGFRTQETGLYEVSGSFEIGGDTARTWTGHLERVTFKCNSSGELQPVEVLDFASSLANQSSRTIYVTGAGGVGLFTLDTVGASAYGGTNENPFTADCSDTSYEDMYTQTVGGAFTYYESTDAGMALPDNFYCNTSADCQVGQSCIEGGCRDTTTTCSSALDCCTQISSAVNSSDLCLYTCQDGYCTDMNVTAPCSGHNACGAGDICWGGSCTAGTIRACEAVEFMPELPLGAIHHSNPVISVAPELDLNIPVYEDFRIANEERDTMLFAGANDGMLHAFLLGDVGPTSSSSEGEEVWAFVPTALKDRLTSLRFGSGDYVDGNIVVKDIRMYRDTAATPVEEWKTVLIGGLRQGGRSYYALDVTDPTSPSLLWELLPSGDFTELGYTYGAAAMGAVYIDDGLIAREKGVAFIPGGAEVASVTGTQGGAFYVVDLATGAVIKEFNAITSTNTALEPVTGTPVAYNSFAGARVSRVFVGDAVGRLLRVDVSAPDPVNWSIEVFYDPTTTRLTGGETIEPVYMAPALAQNAFGQLVLTYGNGDVDALINAAADGNFAVSVSESFDSSLNVTADENWFVNFSAGEKMTGSPVIFNSVAYFPTFAPGTGGCDFGTARLWAPHFVNDDGSGNPVEVLDLVIDGNTDLDLNADFATGTVAYGLEIANRPACVATNNPSTGVYTFSSATPSSPQLIVQTGTAAFGTSTSGPTTTTTSSTNETAEKVRVDLPKPPTTLRELSWALIYE